MFEETVNRPSRWRVFWPEVDDIAGAQEAIRLAVWFAYLAAIISAVGGLIGVVAGGNGMGGIPGAVLFAVLGLGMQRHFRMAAVLGTALVGLGIVVALSQGALPGAVTPFVLVGFVNGVRGTFAVHRLQAAPGSTQAAAPIPPLPPAVPGDDAVLTDLRPGTGNRGPGPEKTAVPR